MTLPLPVFLTHPSPWAESHGLKMSPEVSISSNDVCGVIPLWFVQCGLGKSDRPGFKMSAAVPAM